MKLISNSGEYSRKKAFDFPIAQELASSKVLVVCRKKGEIIAACGMRSPLNILVIHVREGYRGRGIGKELLTKTIEAAEKRRLGFISLTVSSDNIVAFHLYSKFGFKEVASLRETRQILMMLPLTFIGKLAYVIFHTLCLLLPNPFLLYTHSWLYQRTLTD